MLGWVSKPAARASVWNRLSSSGRERPVPTSLKRMVLTATVRPMTGSTALYTTPMAPRPTSSIISYRPAFATMVIVALQPSGPRNGKNTLRLHPDPHFEQYPAYFQQVNATGVLVWRTGYAGLPAWAQLWRLDLSRLHMVFLAPSICNLMVI